jgi:hypothetical protein
VALVVVDDENAFFQFGHAKAYPGKRCTLKQRVTRSRGRHILLQIRAGRAGRGRNIETGMKLRLLLIGAAAAALAAGSALAQPGKWQRGGPERRMERQMQRPMPRPERHMNWEERQRLREQVQSGQMTREQARQHWREERARRAMDPERAERREQLRRDVMEANRDLQRR